MFSIDPEFSSCRPDDVVEGPESNLVQPCDVKGILHAHSEYSDGQHGLRELIDTAQSIGLEYLGISDHWRSENRPDGLDLERFQRQREEIERLKDEYPGFELMQGVQVDADQNGDLDCTEDDLNHFDYVIVSLGGGVDGNPKAETRRALRAMMHSHVGIISKPLDALMLDPGPWPLDMQTVLEAAADAGIAVEIDANPYLPKLDWTLCHQAQEMGVQLSISPDAHRAARLVDYRHGVELARRAGICCQSILNTKTSQQLRSFLR